MRFYSKDATAILDYTEDWTSYLGGDSISSYAYTVPTGLTKVSDSRDGNKTTVFLGGGTAGQSYIVSVSIVTAGGRTDLRQFQLGIGSGFQYCTIEDLKIAIPDGNWGTGYDGYLADAAYGASRAVDAFTHRRDGEWLADAVSSYRYFDGSGKSKQWIDPCVQVDEVAVDETGSRNYVIWVQDQDYILWPYNPDVTSPIMRLDIDLIKANKEAWYRFQKSVRVKSRWGWSATVPRFVFDATVITAIRRFKRAEQAFQDTGAIVELHQLRYVSQLDPDVKALFEGKGFGGVSL